MEDFNKKWKERMEKNEGKYIFFFSLQISAFNQNPETAFDNFGSL